MATVTDLLAECELEVSAEGEHCAAAGALEAERTGPLPPVLRHGTLLHYPRQHRTLPPTPNPAIPAAAATAADLLKAVAEKQGWQPTDSLLRLEGAPGPAAARGRHGDGWGMAALAAGDAAAAAPGLVPLCLRCRRKACRAVWAGGARAASDPAVALRTARAQGLTRPGSACCSAAAS